jgi:hypothetical protein
MKISAIWDGSGPTRMGTPAKDKTQIERFTEAARKLDCDDSEERFVETIKKLASAPPTRNAPSKAKKPKSK